MGIDVEHYAAIIAELDEEISALVKTREVMIRKMTEAGGDATGLEVTPGGSRGGAVSLGPAGAVVSKELRNDSFFSLNTTNAIQKW